MLGTPKCGLLKKPIAWDRWTVTVELTANVPALNVDGARRAFRKLMRKDRKVRITNWKVSKDVHQ